MKRTKKPAILLGILVAICGMILATSGAALAWTGTQGCTPGYWKNHTESWCAYSPSTLFSEAFELSECTNLNKLTLLQVLKNGGGGESALGRHAVAALLNSECYYKSDLDYKYTPTKVTAQVLGVCLSGQFEDIKDILAEENERGCPLD